MVVTAYSFLITLCWLATCIYLVINSHKIAYLKNISALASALPEPSVAIIIAVKDEEAEVEAALKSVIQLQYSNFRIIVINDRSTDRTPAILQEMAKANPSISVITIDELPTGWLGKNHALYQGYKASTEEWLLFTDADVLYAPLALKKAMQYTKMNNLDHLTALPEITSRSRAFKSLMNTFTFMLELKLQPWNARHPSSRASIGVGAFNMVRRTAYEKAGTHTLISLRPDDDLKLGENIKKAGLRQDVVYGEQEVSLQWYTSVAEFINGLMKNTFSISNYHLPATILMALMTFIVFVLPIPLLLLTGQTGCLLAMTILLAQVFLMLFKKGIHGRWWYALIIPFAGLVMVYILIRSAFKTIRQGGIYWRNSFYPLDELKKQR